MSYYNFSFTRNYYVQSNANEKFSVFIYHRGKCLKTFRVDKKNSLIILNETIDFQLKTVLPSKEMHWLASELRKLGKVMDECRLVPAPDSSYQKTQAAKLQGREEFGEYCVTNDSFQRRLATWSVNLCCLCADSSIFLL